MSSIRVTGHVRVFENIPGLTQSQIMERAPVAEGPNLIVDNGLEWVAKKLGHVAGTPPIQVGGQTVSSLDDLEIAEIQLGNEAVPAAPASTDTALSDLTPIATYTSITVTYPTAASVRFAATIPPDTIAGEGITEIGLFLDISSTKVMVGRRLFSPPIVIAPATGYTAAYDISLS